MAKPEKAQMVENMLCQMAQTGQIQNKVKLYLLWKGLTWVPLNLQLYALLTRLSFNFNEIEPFRFHTPFPYNIFIGKGPKLTFIFHHFHKNSSVTLQI